MLGDYCSGRIWTTTITGATATRKVLLQPRVQSPASFGIDAAGELYVVSLQGRVYRFVA